MEPKASIGRTVHVMWFGTPKPAIITAVADDGKTIDATVFGGIVPGTATAIAAAQTAHSLSFTAELWRREDETAHGWWFWPPRV